MVRLDTVTLLEDLAHVQRLFREYADSLDVDLKFQEFEVELASLPGPYAEPAGRLILARVDAAVAGCAALRRIDGEVCEVKRLFVRPAFRALRIGVLLVERIIDEARRIEYRRMRLDTLPSMKTAMRLYESFGFRDINPYRFNPLERSRFMELEL